MQAISLWMAGLQLLLFLNTHPGIPQDLADRVTTVANIAIAYGQEHKNDPETPVQVTSPVVVAPQVSTAPVIESVPQVATSMAVENKGGWLYGGNCGYPYFLVKVLDQNGNSMMDQPVTLVKPENSVFNEILTATTTDSNNVDVGEITAYLRIRPQQVSGPMTITFNSGKLSKDLTLNLLSMRDRLVNSDGSLNLGEARAMNIPDSPELITITQNGNAFDLITNMCK